MIKIVCRKPALAGTYVPTQKLVQYNVVQYKGQKLEIFSARVAVYTIWSQWHVKKRPV